MREIKELGRERERERERRRGEVQDSTVVGRDHVKRREYVESHAGADKPGTFRGGIADLETNPNTCRQGCHPAPHTGLHSSRQREQETWSQNSKTVPRYGALIYQCSRGPCAQNVRCAIKQRHW